MLKLNASFSKKVPVTGQDFSSQSYHASVEVELSDVLEPQQIQSKIHDTFAIVKEAVEAELNGKSQPVTRTEFTPERNGNGSGEKASNKQIKYLTDLARDRDISISELNKQARELYHADSIYGLTKKDASRLVDDLKRMKAA
jgi:hypothetical protein